MAAPNLVNVSSVTGKSAHATPNSTAPNVLLANAAGSNKVLKVNLVLAVNVDGVNAAAATVAINTSATGSGTSYPLASTVSVPANASLVVIDKASTFYLEEDRSLVVTAGSASKITFVVSYEEMA